MEKIVKIEHRRHIDIKLDFPNLIHDYTDNTLKRTFVVTANNSDLKPFQPQISIEHFASEEKNFPRMIVRFQNVTYLCCSIPQEGFHVTAIHPFLGEL